LDPPRGGLHIDAEAAIAACGVKNIIYISCNPLTLARDLEELTKNYNIKNVEAFDFFPNTKHIETLVELELK
jgi:tRNA/tmRNA/rRNA uracil-C5-methylase (TrmA/RlmC/RlmD family)